jgi:hypothetical protein
MAYLLLNDDDVALLRFTCDLFFVEESPLYFLEVEQREPTNYEHTYQDLLKRKIIDPTAFRITDDALNRVAPVTECDARVVQIKQRGNEEVASQDFYLLDEIAVQYDEDEIGHLLGQDLDQDELVDYLGRRLVPRKSSGDMLNAALSPVETVGLAILSPHLRGGQGPKGLPLDQVNTLLGASPNFHPRTGDHNEDDTALFSVLGVRTLEKGADGPRPGDIGPGLIADPVWDRALASLLEQGLFRLRDSLLFPSMALQEFLDGLGGHERQTFVRYDFAEDEWMLRETTFVPVEGGLFWVGMQPDGLIGIRELDGDGLFSALHEAVGPLPRVDASPEPLPIHHMFMKRV